MLSTFFQILVDPGGGGGDYTGDFQVDNIIQGGNVGYSVNNLADLLGGPANVNIVTLIFFAAGAFFVVNIVLAGFSMMTSAGSPKGVQDGKTRLTNAFAGLALVFLAYFIVQLVGQVLNLPGITSTFGG